MATSKSFLKEARAIARACPKPEAKAVLMAHTDELANVFRQFTVSCSQDDMHLLVAAWTRVALDISGINKLGGDNTPAGKMSAPVEEKFLLTGTG